MYPNDGVDVVAETLTDLANAFVGPEVEVLPNYCPCLKQE
jgi:hypothetical protein